MTLVVDMGPPGLQGKDGPWAPGSSTAPARAVLLIPRLHSHSPRMLAKTLGGPCPASHCSLHQVPDTDCCPRPHSLPHLCVAACAEESGWGCWRP